METGEYRAIKFTIEGDWTVTKTDPFDSQTVLTYTNDNQNDAIHIFATEDLMNLNIQFG